MEYDPLTGTYFDEDGALRFADPIGYLQGVYMDIVKTARFRDVAPIMQQEAKAKYEIREKYKRLARERGEASRGSPSGGGYSPYIREILYERGPHGETWPGLREQNQQIPTFAFNYRRKQARK